MAAAVVGGEHRGQHQAPGQQGDGAAGSAGDVVGAINTFWAIERLYDRVKY